MNMETENVNKDMESEIIALVASLGLNTEYSIDRFLKVFIIYLQNKLFEVGTMQLENTINSTCI